MSDTPITFADCFGWLHLPSEPARTTGVVLCPPFGCEWLWTHRSYRHLALALRDAGFAVLRFDYHGTGDSLGGDTDPDRPAAWLASIGAATDTLKARAGVAEVALFGLRLGGTLAAAAAASRTDVPSLVLWAPFPTGRAFVREARAFALLKNEPQGEDLQVAGFVVKAATVEALSRLDALAHPPTCREALLLARDDVSGDNKLATHFLAHGVAVTAPSIAGYAAMMRDPHQAEVPQAALQTVVQWLAERHTARLPAPVSPPSQEAALLGPHFREHACVFADHAALFGIITEPLAPRTDRPAIVLLNVGSNHHIGPNRMTVTLARELALSGFTSLRFDIAGLGDSVPAPGAPENRLYAQASVEDAKAAITLFGERCVLVGLCSGAYLAYYTTLADPRVHEQILINLQTFLWRDGDSLDIAMRRSYKSTRFYRAAILRSSVWRNLLRGRVNWRGIVRILAHRLLVRLMTELAQRDAGVARAFTALAARGTASLLIFGHEDGGIDEMERHLGPSARKLRKQRQFRLDFIADADHTFTPLAARTALIAKLCRHLCERYP
jgi:pimeloyl-ACP methyl ester carboxylesterase